MKRAYLLPLLLSLAPCSALGHTSDDPLLFGLNVGQFEWSDQDQLAVGGDFWAGRDLRKFWLKFDLEYASGDLQEVELQALYRVAVSPYWELLAGLRHDARPQPANTWGALGLAGVAPYFIDTELKLFMGEGGAVALQLAFGYELNLTQNWSLSPALELDLRGQNDSETGAGSGLSELTAGLRLGYEVRPDLTPYVGVEYWQVFGNSADFARAVGDETADTAWIAGLSFWF